MSNSWDEMKRAKEEGYFERKNREALERLATKKSKDKARLSPITGEPMEQIVIHGVVVDRCATSGGIWLDAGELGEILAAVGSAEAGAESWLTGFIKSLTKK